MKLKLCQILGVFQSCPSNFGGVIEHMCVSMDTDKAEFVSTNKDWPTGFVMAFDQPDFTLADFEMLAEALTAYSKWNIQPSNEQREIVRKAHELGYAHAISYTQASWSDKGIEVYRSLM